jgi:hypothetical protein
MLIRTLFVLASFAWAGMALAQPSFDIERHCRELAGFGGTFSRVTYGTCLRMEREAAHKIDLDWSSVAQSIRQHCVELARFGGSPSYTTLQTCIRMELL